MSESKDKEKLQRTHLNLAVALSIFFFAYIYFGFFSLSRLISKDAGFYVIAAQLITQGKLLYKDFFYAQPPLYPYLLAGWFKIFGTDWYASRLFSVFWCALSSVVLFFFLKQNIVALIVGEVFYFSCSFVLYWHTTSQSYALANFLFMLAVYLYSKSFLSERRLFFLSGIFLGLSISVKLFYLPTAFLLWGIKLVKDASRKNLSSFLCFSFGIATGVIPFIIFLFIDWQRTFFGNIYYHLNRTDFSPFSESVRDLRIFSVLFGFKKTPKFAVHQAQVLSWFLLLSGLFFILRDKKKLVSPLYLVSFFLFASIFIPSPSYLKYFAISAPFIIILFSEVLGSIFFKAKESSDFFLHVGVSLLFFCVGIFWFSGIGKDFIKYTKTGEGVIGIGMKRNAPNWRIETVTETGRYVEAFLAKRGGKVLPYDWVGYFLGHKASILEGYETRFSHIAALNLSVKERRKFKVKSFEDFKRDIEGGKAQVVVISPGKFSKELNSLLNNSGYRFRKRVRGIFIFEKK